MIRLRCALAEKRDQGFPYASHSGYPTDSMALADEVASRPAIGAG